MFGIKKRKPEDQDSHIVVPPEDSQQGVNSDPYHEVISPDDLVGIVPAKQEVLGVHTPLQEVSEELNLQKKETPVRLQVQETPPRPFENQFVVDEVASALEQTSEALVPSVEADQEVAPRVITEGSSLEDLKKREQQLENHFAQRASDQREQDILYAEKAEDEDLKKVGSGVGGRAEGEAAQAPATLGGLVDQMEHDLGSLAESANRALREEAATLPPQTQQVGSVYQEASPAPAQESSGVEVRSHESSLDSARSAIEKAYDEAHISGVESFDALFTSLDQVPNFTSSDVGIYALEELKQQIAMVREGNAPINVITKTGGLRKKVLELTNQEMAA